MKEAYLSWILYVSRKQRRIESCIGFGNNSCGRMNLFDIGEGNIVCNLEHNNLHNGSLNIQPRIYRNCNKDNLIVVTHSPLMKKSTIPSLFMTNICHVSHKMDKLYFSDPSVVLITESWLSSEIPDTAVDIDTKYCVHHLDRPTPDGGVLVYSF